MPLCAFCPSLCTKQQFPDIRETKCVQKKKRDERKNTSENGKVSQLNAALVHRLKNVS